MIDKEEAIEALGGDEAIYQEICNLFLSESVIALQTIKEALLENDFTKLMKKAHSLRTSSGTVGAKEVTHLIKQVEASANNNDLQQTTQLINDLETAINKINTYLQKTLVFSTLLEYSRLNFSNSSITFFNSTSNCLTNIVI